MAEALSIIGAISSIAGIIDVLGKAINVIYELRNQWSEAANTVVGIVAQLVALKAALAKIKEWTESKVDEPHHQLTIDLDGSISCCKMIVERIDSWLSELQRKPNGELEVSAKFKVTLGSKSMDDLQKNLGYQVNALNLLLNACNCKSISEQKAFLEKRSTRKSLERANKDSASLIVHRDSKSLLSHYTDNLSKLSMAFSFDGALQGTGVYVRAARALTKASLERQQSEVHRKRNEEIERQLLEDRQKQAREIKMLALGDGQEEFFHKMKIATSSLTHRERKLWRVVVFNTLVNAFEITLAEMDEQHIEFEDDKNFWWADLVASNLEIGPDDPLPRETLQAFVSLWEDKGIQRTLLKADEHALYDNLSYFLCDIHRLYELDYLPTDEDICHARFRTTGIREIVYELGNITYRIFNAGRQRSERKKWIHVFDNVQFVIFLASLSSYDESFIEDRNGNKLHESLMLFESISNSKFFENSSIILIFTRTERFREKLSFQPNLLTQYFPEYQGPPTDLQAAQDFFTDRFRNCVRNANKSVYVYHIDEIDTTVFKNVHISVHDDVVQRNLEALMR